MKKLNQLFALCLLILMISGCGFLSKDKKTDLVSLDQLAAGAQAPMGMSRVNPKFIQDSGNTILAGFTHTAYAKNGLDFLLLPAINQVDLTKSIDNQEFIKDFYVDVRDDLSARKPGYFSLLTNNEIAVKVAASERAAMYQFSFPVQTKKVILFNSIVNELNDTTAITYLIQENMNTLLGYTSSSANPDKIPVFFAIRFSQPFSSMWTRSSEGWSFNVDSAYSGHDLLALFSFNKEPDTIKMKVGLSTSSMEGAVVSMKSIMGWDFKAFRDSSLNFWENMLLKACSDSYSDEETEAACNTSYKLLTRYPLLSDDYEEFWFHSGRVMKSQGFKKYDVSFDKLNINDAGTQVLMKYPEYYNNLQISRLDDRIGNDSLMQWIEINGRLPELDEMKD